MTDSLPVDEDQLRGQYIETAIRDLANAPYALKLANTQDRRDWVRNLGLNDFVLFLTRFNARLRGIDPNIHKFDSENVRVTSQDRRNTLYTPPPIEVNSPLLHQTLHALHKLAENPALPNDAAMRRIGLTAAGQ